MFSSLPIPFVGWQRISIYTDAHNHSLIRPMIESEPEPSHTDTRPRTSEPYRNQPLTNMDRSTESNEHRSSDDSGQYRKRDGNEVDWV